ncbi:MAG: TolC family protein [Pirellulales bacterium]|nr:TolC family protein [Pirellulales bacterium]
MVRLFPTHAGHRACRDGSRRTLRAWLGCLLGLLSLLSSACRPTREFYFHDENDLSHYKGVATTIDFPNVETPPPQAAMSMPPRTLWNHEKTDYWNLSLQEAVQLALANSPVMHDLGGRVVALPEASRSVYDPAITETDPRYGVQAALSRYDAIWSTGVFWERDDRMTNNLILGGGVRDLQQDGGLFRTQIQKTTATGAQFAARHHVDYAANNLPFNLFPSAWNTNVEAEFRQPMLRGGGLTFNQIAGPGAQPGFYFQNGVLLARVDTDRSLAEFEEGVRNFVNEVENAYWDLYLAYRELDAAVASRDSALRTWRRAKELLDRGAIQGTAANEARAAAQYFAFRAAVENALSGRTGVATRATATSPSGALVGAGGLYAAESNLRLMMGLTENDGRLLRPAEEPTTARVAFEWTEVAPEALIRRVELRKQKWTIKRRELELTAARNFLLPKLDAVGLYRWRGFGNELLDPSGNQPEFQNAYENLTSGNFQEWQLGVQAEIPLGFREGFTAVRNAQLKLSRERQLYSEQERQVAHDLAAAIREMHRAYDVSQTRMNLRMRAKDRVDALERELDAGRERLDQLLDAQRDLAEADAGAIRALVEYNLAIKAVHFQKGSLLDYNEIHLAEGPWPRKAYDDALRQAYRRAAACELDYRMKKSQVVSCGPYAQQTEMLQTIEVESVPAGESVPAPLPNAAPAAPLPPTAPISHRRTVPPEAAQLPPHLSAPPANAGSGSPAPPEAASAPASRAPLVTPAPANSSPADMTGSIAPVSFSSPLGETLNIAPRQQSVPAAVPPAPADARPMTSSATSTDTVAPREGLLRLPPTVH